MIFILNIIKIIGFIVLLFLVDCSKEVHAIANEEISVMKEPYPKFYTNIDNMKIIAIDKNDTFAIIDSSYGKDFKCYKVRFKSKRGYVFNDNNFRRLK